MLTGVAACADMSTPPTPIAGRSISLPGERSANPALATPPDEWQAPPRQTAQARTRS